ncbi:MAG: hypothetical protein V1736_06095 [Pseudomonadota bacterium]
MELIRRCLLFSVAISIICCPGRAVAAPPLVLGDAEIVPYEQWEVWLSCSYKETKDERAYKAPTLEVIYGLLPRLEWSLETTYFVDENGDKSEGIECIGTQPKYLLVEEGDRNPALTAALQVEVPTDDDQSRLDFDECVYAPAIASEKHFGPVLLVGQVKYFIDKKWRYGMDLMYEWDDELKFLAEVYGHHYTNSEKLDELNFRLGFKYKFVENGKVYFAAGRSISHAEDTRPLFEAMTGIMFEY